MQQAARQDLGHLFCVLPFSYAEIHPNGKVYMCCPRYSGLRAIGNVFTDAPDKIWNSARAQRIRAGIHDGSFRLCDHTECPGIAGRQMPLRTDVLASAEFGAAVRARAVVLPAGPSTVKLCHDESCNLSCPSCRRHLIVAEKARQARLDRMVNEFILPFLADTRLLVLSGDGDPFASKHYRDVLKATKHDRPRLRIGLHTNGVLCDERAWDDCLLEDRVDTVEVSIDAADPFTYALVRRGGDFARLRRNLGFLARQRRAGQIKELQLSFVVQAANFREMPAFVALGKEFGVDRIRFALIRHWWRGFSLSQYPRARVWSAKHPLFDEFLAVLRDPLLDDPIVLAGDVGTYIAEARGAAPVRAAASPNVIERVATWIGR
jgi:MoaA/NifB/PqqE/SkfB family radical SAM enzyme